MKIGYARVSTDEQNLDLQRQALDSAGCEKIYEDEGISGAAVNRPALGRTLSGMQEGDVLVAWKLDRPGRSLQHLIEVINGLREDGVEFCSLQEQIDTTSADGRFYFHMLAALAQFEGELISERTRAGMSAARRRGVHLGRPPKLAPHQVRHALELLAAEKTRGEVAAILRVSPKTLWRALSGGEHG